MKPSGRKLAFCLLLATIGSGFAESKPSPGHSIGFHIAQAKNTKAKLGHFYGSDIVYLDSAKFDQNGKVTFKGSYQLPEGLYVVQFGDQTLDFVVSEQRFSISTSLPLMDYSTQIKNSMENKVYFDYKRFMIKEAVKADSLRKVISENPADAASKERFRNIKTEIASFRTAYFAKYPHHLATKIIKAGLEVKSPNRQEKDSSSSNRLQRERMFDNIDLLDPRLTRTPYVEEKILQYLKLTAFHPDSLRKSCDEIMQLTFVNREMHQFALARMMKNFETSNKPWMDVLYTHLGKDYYLPDSNLHPKMEALTVKANMARFAPLLTGNVAPAIDFMDTLMRKIPLYSVKANYTILYFWDADCEHCKEITPKLWDLYQKIHPYGVEVYAVTIQQVYYSWQEYLRKHKMTWINVFDPVNIQQTYQTYQIGNTPCIYLLDSDKRILCKKISLKELEMYLHMLLEDKKQ